MALEHAEIREMLEVAVVAARLAGQRAMEEIKYIKASIKNDREMVTHADGLCQQIIIDRIKEAYPDHGFIAEEGPGGALFRQPPRTAESIWWAIDPIDGTNNFSHGLLCFAVSIAALHEGMPIVGVIFDPATESMYAAAQGMEAQLNDSRIVVSDDGISRFASFGIDSHIPTDQMSKIGQVMLQTRFRNLGTTALHMAYVAKGSMIGMISNDAKLWDIAAGTALVELARGVVTDLAGKGVFPLRPEEYAGQSCTVLAANRKTHGLFLKHFAR